MKRARVLMLSSVVLALSSQLHAVADPATRVAAVKGKSLCLVEGAGVNCLAASPGGARLPLWSKDGEKVAFIEGAPPSRALAMLRVVDRHGQSLLVLPIKPVVAGETNSGMRGVESLQWIDAHRIAISGSVNPSTQETLVVDLQRNEVVDEFIDDGGGVAFSPDGKHVAQLQGAPHFTQQANRRPVLRVDGKDVALPASVKTTEFGTPLWSPDSQAVAVPMKDAAGRDVVLYWQPRGSRILDLPAQPSAGSVRTRLFWSGSMLQVQRTAAVSTPARPGERAPATESWSLNPSAKLAAWTKLADNPEHPGLLARAAKADALKSLPAELRGTPAEQADVWCRSCGIDSVSRQTRAANE